MPALVNTRFDATWFIAPSAISVTLALGWGLEWGTPGDIEREVGLPIWILVILAVDVAHVWASLYRTYLDPQARRLHRRRLWITPLACAWFGFGLHLESPRVFWGVLAYVAVFHFIKQHVGFAMLYARAGDESPSSRRAARAAVWAGTLGPIVWWHAHLPRRFTWFMEPDFVAGLPGSYASVALAAELPFWLAFGWNRWQARRRGRRNPWLVAMVLAPALNWHVGIVVFDDDRIFTITNVLGHGIPYLALVWVTGGRDRVERALQTTRWTRVALAYYAFVAMLAVTEETLWDRWVWHDRPGLFGVGPDLSPVGVSLAVALLAVPQTTHYLLDRWIWRVGPDNPRLGEQLGLTPRKDPVP